VEINSALCVAFAKINALKLLPLLGLKEQQQQSVRKKKKK
jgi:hypothetical protein